MAASRPMSVSGMVSHLLRAGERNNRLTPDKVERESPLNCSIIFFSYERLNVDEVSGRKYSALACCWCWQRRSMQRTAPTVEWPTDQGPEDGECGWSWNFVFIFFYLFLGDEGLSSSYRLSQTRSWTLQTLHRKRCWRQPSKRDVIVLRI